MNIKSVTTPGTSAATSKKSPLLGILGGLGPLASVYFYELLTLHTMAVRDSDHLDLILSSRSTTPDRTAFLLGQSDRDPAPVMCEEARRLERAGAELIAVPCNTAHCFYHRIVQAVNIPVLNIIEETIKLLSFAGVKQIGLLATEGTVHSRAYHEVCERYGMVCQTPSVSLQEQLNRIIYDQIKQGDLSGTSAFQSIANIMLQDGCERLVLGCTELSLFDRDSELDPVIFADSLKILAFQTIRACGKQPVRFPEWFERSLREGYT